MTDQKLLDQLDAVIEAKLSGDAVTEYSVGGDSFRFTPVERLMDQREKLQQRIAGMSGRSFHLAMNGERL